MARYFETHAVFCFEVIKMNKITERIDNTTYNKDLMEVCPPPISVKIELSSQCNLKCHFCAHSSSKRVNSEMNIELFDSIIDDLNRFGVKEIGLFYLGESFMCSWLKDAISICKNKYKIPYTFLTTNGILLNEKNVTEVFESGLDSLKFSYNSYDEESFSKETGCRGNLFNKLNDNIKLTRRIRDDGKFKCGIYASSISHLNKEKMEKCLIENVYPYVDEHYFLPLYNHGGFIKDNKIIRGGNTGRLDSPRSPIPCWGLFKEGHITADGKVSACCFGQSENFFVGDCNKNKFSDIWNDVGYKKLRNLHLEGDLDKLKNSPCANCLLLK